MVRNDTQYLAKKPQNKTKNLACLQLSSKRLQVWSGLSGTARAQPGIWVRNPVCGTEVLVKQVCECVNALANEPQAGPTNEQVTSGEGKRAWKLLRGVGWTEGSCQCLRDPLTPERILNVCCQQRAFLSTRQRGGEDLAVCVCVLCQSYMQVVLKAAPCLWEPVQLAVLVCSIREFGIRAQCQHWLNSHMRKQQLHPLT